jgi:hypothetical protein
VRETYGKKLHIETETGLKSPEILRMEISSILQIQGQSKYRMCKDGAVGWQ